MGEVIGIGADARDRLSTTVALIAHDERKDDLARLVRANRKVLRNYGLVATADTGRPIREETGLTVDLVASGPEGGHLQIAARVIEARVDAVIFLRDPLTAQPHEPEADPLIRTCDVHDVPIATNLSTAAVLVRFLADHARRVERRRRLQEAAR